MSTTSPLTKKLFIDLQPRVLGLSGYDAFDSRVAGIAGKAKLLASQAERDAATQLERAGALARAKETAYDRVERASYKASQAELRYNQVVAKSGEDAAERYKLAWLEAIRQKDMARQRSDAASAAADEQQARAMRAQSLAGGAQTRARIATGLGLAGTAVGGAGAVGLGLGYEVIKQGMGWQTYTSQQIANSPMTPQEQAAFKALSLRLGAKDGARPEDIFLALRYGSELGLGQSADQRYLKTALMLGLPTGGSAAIAPSMQALATVRKNFPQLGNNPNAIGNMILTASQNSAGVTAADFVGSIPKLLNIAGHIGGQDQFQQALALTAALTSAGMPLDEAQTQATNLITKIFKPSPATWKYLGQLKKGTGIDVSGDFGAQALQQKGLVGVINDLASHNLGPTTLGYLFPNMRGYFGALGLTGNQNTSFNNILGRVNGAPQANPLGTNFNRYLGLDSTEAKKLQEQLHVMAITLGTELLPPFNQLLKDDIVPLVGAFSKFSQQHKGLIADFIKMSPWLIAAGLGFKAIGAGLTVISGASRAASLLGGMSGSMAKIGASGAAAEVSAVSRTATTGIGTATTSAAAGSGILGLATAYALLAAGMAAVGYEGLKGISKIPGARTKSAFGLPFNAADAAGLFFFPPLAIYDALTGHPITGGKSAGPATYTGKSALYAGAGRAASPAPAGYPNPLAFGLPTPSWYRDSIANPYSSFITSQDSQATMAFGGGPAVHDWNFGVPVGTPARLPIKAQLLKIQSIQGGGWYVYFKARNGGVFFYEHLSEVNVHAPGQWYPAGTVVGLSGKPTSPKWGQGAQLSVTADARATSAIMGKSVANLPAAGGGGINASIAAAATQYHENPALLYGVYKAEGGSSASPLFGDPSGTASGAAASLAADFHWTYTLKGMALMKAYGFPNTTQGHWDAALAVYNGGYAVDTRKDGDAHGKAYVANVHAAMAGWTGGGQVNFTPPSGAAAAKAGKNNPQTPYEWSQWWAQKAGNLGGVLGTIGDIFTTEYGKNWGPHSLTGPEWHGAVKLLDSYYFDQYQQARSLANSEFKNDPKRRNAVISAAWNAYQKELKHPFQYGPFAQSATGSAATNRVSPVQVVGNNRQLAAAEQTVRRLDRVIEELKKGNRQEEARIKRLEQTIKQLVKWINGHGGHAQFNDGSGVVTVGGPGG